MLNYKRYKESTCSSLSGETVAGQRVQKAPVWCSVDLRDGNQALIEPMVVEEKIEFFNLLVKLGFKEIEVGFPAASQIEYDFLRTLVVRNLIPDDVKVQVLIQCREHLIKRHLRLFRDARMSLSIFTIPHPPCREMWSLIWVVKRSSRLQLMVRRW